MHRSRNNKDKNKNSFPQVCAATSTPQKRSTVCLRVHRHAKDTHTDTRVCIGRCMRRSPTKKQRCNSLTPQLYTIPGTAATQRTAPHNTPKQRHTQRHRTDTDRHRQTKGGERERDRETERKRLQHRKQHTTDNTRHRHIFRTAATPAFPHNTPLLVRKPSLTTNPGSRMGSCEVMATRDEGVAHTGCWVTLIDIRLEPNQIPQKTPQLLHPFPARSFERLPAMHHHRRHSSTNHDRVGHQKLLSSEPKMGISGRQYLIDILQSCPQQRTTAVVPEGCGWLPSGTFSPLFRPLFRGFLAGIDAAVANTVIGEGPPPRRG